MNTPRANRTTELIKEFSRQGHNVLVYAVIGKFDYSGFEKEFNVEVKNIPIKFQKIPYTSDNVSDRAFIDKVLGRMFGKLFEFPYIEFMFNLKKIIRSKKNVDLLISIADPHHIHWGCAKAKMKYPEDFPKTWVADCGDPFMANVKNNYHYSYYSRYERLFCSLCDFITVPVVEAVDAYYTEFHHKIKVIPQGFKFNFPIETKAFTNNVIPTFAYAGMFYKDIRNPKQLFDYLIRTKHDFRFIIYTKYKELVIPYQNILKDKLIIRDAIDRVLLIEKLSEMDFLINIENQNSPNQTPSKLIDYSIAGRPILSINNLRFDGKVIDDFLSGDYTKRYIVNNIEQYNIKGIVRKFIELLHINE